MKSERNDESLHDLEAGFTALGLDERLVSALLALGYEAPTPIQREAIAPLLEGRDLIGQAATGTGKTAAFALPLLHQMAASGREDPRPFGLVLVPTRELAIQVAEATHRYGASLRARVLPIYGGQPYGQQLRALRRGVDVVVATPGRALDHIGRGTLAIDALRVLVLDEADEMLDMGFADELEAIIEATPASRQTVLFSATMPPRIRTLATRYLRDPVRVEIGRERVPYGELPRLRQTAYLVRRADKLAALGRILDIEDPGAAIVFCRTRNEVDELSETLSARGYRCEALHGGMSQTERDRVMGKLRSGAAELVCATDVAARGLDISQLTHVLNFDVPSDPGDYVHRIGRVGRAGREGVAITLAEPREHRLLRNFERLTKQPIEVAKMPTAAQLRERRLELTRDAIRETIADHDLERYRALVESLADEFDLMEIAMAAAKRAHDKLSPDAGEVERDIPDARPPIDRPRRPERAEGRGRPAMRPRGPRGDERGRPRHAGEATKIFIGAGRDAGVTPRDLVGAIANEAKVPGKVVGAIEITSRFSLVEVPPDLADRVIDALRATTIKGRRVLVKRDRRPQ
jgi:ATP-dependent RNA helicase DeaD